MRHCGMLPIGVVFVHPIDVSPEVEARDNLVGCKKHADWVVNGRASSDDL